MMIQENAMFAAVGAAGGAAAAMLVGGSLATSAVIGAAATTVGMIAIEALSNLGGAYKWLEENLGKDVTFFASYLGLNTGAAVLISQVAGLGISLTGALFPVVGSLAAMLAVGTLASVCNNSAEAV